MGLLVLLIVVLIIIALVKIIQYDVRIEIVEDSKIRVLMWYNKFGCKTDRTYKILWGKEDNDF